MESSKSLSRRPSFRDMKSSLKRRLSSMSLKERSANFSVTNTYEPNTQNIDLNTQNIDFNTQDTAPIKIDLEKSSDVSKTDFGTQENDTDIPRIGMITRKATIPIKDTKYTEGKDTPYSFHGDEKESILTLQDSYDWKDQDHKTLQKLYKEDQSLLSDRVEQRNLRMCLRSINGRLENEEKYDPEHLRHCKVVQGIITDLQDGKHHSIRMYNRVPDKHRLQIEDGRYYRDQEEAKLKSNRGECDTLRENDKSDVDNKSDNEGEVADEDTSIVSISE